MLFVVLFFLIISSIAIFFLRRDTQSKLMLGLCISFVCMFVGIIIYLAKTGGLQSGQMFLLFFDKRIQLRLSYMIFPLKKLGFLIAIGRTLFPGFLLMIAVNYSMHPNIIRWKRRSAGLMILPILTLVVYYPRVFLNLPKLGENVQFVMINLTIGWISLYLLASFFLLVQEYSSVTIPFCRKQFRYIMGFLISIGIMYSFYFRQDPIQVYQMYSAQYMRFGGLLYSGVAGGAVSRWIFLTIITTLFGIFGFWSLRTYTMLEHEEAVGEVMMQKKIDMASKGISVFVHGMKNQLLSNRVLSEKLNAELAKAEPDRVKLQEYATMIADVNRNMLVRMEELYKSIKSNYIRLVPTEVPYILDRTLERFHEKYPEVTVRVTNLAETMVLADASLLSEALYNLLLNGYESILEAGRETAELELKTWEERLYVTFQIIDNGMGMSRQVQKKIFDPFYTSKNTNNNWGMGLYYVRQVVKNHLGILKLESVQEQGTRFFVAIPRYEQRNKLSEAPYD